jgi:DNA-directed RNA polymerase subunit H (RpoH/RPB5)
MERNWRTLFQIKITQVEMIRDRGYDITNEIFPRSATDREGRPTPIADSLGDATPLLTISFDAFVARYSTYIAQLASIGARVTPRTMLTSIYLDRSGRKMLVYYAHHEPKATSLKKEEAANFAHLATAHAVTDAIVISKHKLSTDAEEAVLGMVSWRSQIFFDSEMMFNKTKHILVPKHILLSPEQAREFLKVARVKFSQLPRIFKGDPIIRYYGWQPGGIVLIYRSEYFLANVIKTTIFYRAIVESPTR